MSTNFLYAQAPNRVGNKSKHTPEGNTGVTAVTRPSGGTQYAAGRQGAPKAGANPLAGGQKVQVSRPECYDKTPRNDGYMNKSVKNYGG